MLFSPHFTKKKKQTRFRGYVICPSCTASSVKIIFVGPEGVVPLKKIDCLIINCEISDLKSKNFYFIH